jgi:hypothetical protein
MSGPNPLRPIIGTVLVLFALSGLSVWAYRTFGKNEAAAPVAAPVMAPVGATAATPRDASAKAVVYYFRTNFRCPTCMKLETYTREAVEKHFADEVKRGEVLFVMLNVEEEPNAHFIRDYSLKTKSVVLASPAHKDRWKNLDQIWKRVGDKEGYLQYIREELKGFLAGLD